MSYYQQQPQQQQQVYYDQQQPQQQQYYYDQQQPQQQQQYYQQPAVQQQQYYQQQEQQQYQQQDPYQQQQQYYTTDIYNNNNNYQQQYQQQQDPNVQYIDVEGQPGDTVVIEQNPDGTITQRRIPATEREQQSSDPTKKTEVSAEEALSFVQREKAQENNSNQFDPDLILNIASKWNVSPPKERRMRYLVADLDETVRTSEQKVGDAEAGVLQQQQQGQQNQDDAVAAAAAAKKKQQQQEEDEEDQAIAVIGVIERPPNSRLMASKHRVDSVLAKTRGSGFDRLRTDDRPNPPTVESMETSASEFANCLDYFRAETAKTLMSCPRGNAKNNTNASFANNQQQQETNAVIDGNSFDVTKLDDVEVAEIDQRERNRDEVDDLRDHLIYVSNQVIQAHDRLKKEGGRASEASQLVAHRQAPIRNNISPPRSASTPHYATSKSNNNTVRKGTPGKSSSNNISNNNNINSRRKEGGAVGVAGRVNSNKVIMRQNSNVVVQPAASPPPPVVAANGEF